MNAGEGRRKDSDPAAARFTVFCRGGGRSKRKGSSVSGTGACKAPAAEVPHRKENQRRTMHFVGHFSIAASQETPVLV